MLPHPNTAAAAAGRAGPSAGPPATEEGLGRGWGVGDTRNGDGAEGCGSKRGVGCILKVPSTLCSECGGMWVTLHGKDVRTRPTGSETPDIVEEAVTGAILWDPSEEVPEESDPQTGRRRRDPGRGGGSGVQWAGPVWADGSPGEDVPTPRRALGRGGTAVPCAEAGKKGTDSTLTPSQCPHPWVRPLSCPVLLGAPPP